jgi:hypothetical protein
VRLIGGDATELALPRDAGARLRKLYRDEALPSLLPLVDWRALAMPPPPDEVFALVPGDPSDPATVRLAALRMSAGRYAAFRPDGLLLFPARVSALLRTIQCAATDPVSFAVVERSAVAEFPEVAGWSARDWARRAVAEHRAWLESRVEGPGDRVQELGKTLTAARAALFRASLDDGEPELALSLAAVAERLAAHDTGARAVAEEAVDAYRAARRGGVPVAARTFDELAETVRRLPAYAR